jgi:hypothetical protein
MGAFDRRDAADAGRAEASRLVRQRVLGVPQRVVEFSFDSLEAGGRYSERPEMIRVFQAELPRHGTYIGITVLKRLSDCTRDDVAG